MLMRVRDESVLRFSVETREGSAQGGVSGDAFNIVAVFGNATVDEAGGVSGGRNVGVYGVGPGRVVVGC